MKTMLRLLIALIPITLLFAFAYLAGHELDSLLQTMAPTGAGKWIHPNLPPFSMWCVRHFEGVNYAFGGIKWLLMLPCSALILWGIVDFAPNDSGRWLGRYLAVAFVLFALVAFIAIGLFRVSMVTYMTVMSLWIDDQQPLTNVQRGLVAAHMLCAVAIVWGIVQKSRRRPPSNSSSGP